MDDAIGEPSPMIEPKAAEARWTVSETLRAIEEAAPISIVALDRDGHVMIWNAAAERLFGWSASEVIGGSYPLVPDDQQAEYHSLRARALRGEALSGIEVRRRRKDGSLIDISLSTAPIREANGHPAVDFYEGRLRVWHRTNAIAFSLQHVFESLHAPPWTAKSVHSNRRPIAAGSR